MRIIFTGTSDFGIPTLEMLKRGYDLVAVITQPDKPTGRKKVMTPPPTKVWALANDIKVLQPKKIADSLEEIKSLSPDVMVVAAYGQIIPLNVLNIPKKGSINLHASLLPKLRGASPIQTAIMNDEKESGVTVMIMDEKLDHGPIISSISIPIDDSDDYNQLHNKLSLAGAKILSETLPQWINGSIKGQEQDHNQATFTKLLKRDDARIDWTKPAKQIVQKIKALNPEPGAWTTLDKKSVKIINAVEVKTGKIDLPGKINLEGNDCLVKCGDYSLKLIQVQIEGKNPISGQDFLNGLKNPETKVFV
ncbi:MAG: methionyl-tRNA formyltransferase [Candidatus Doudnabacteria bacterium]|nr:methionyl-tRNA formyltransferase [Candidatus Doudnabacteria bacterium]